MWSRGIAKGQIRRHQVVKVLLAEDDEEPQALVLNGFHPSLNEGLLVRGSRCRPDHPALGVLEDLVELGDVHPVA
jgi:hypothetical protein